MLRIERQDNRDSHQDIREGLGELNNRIWHIEVKLGIRDESGRIKENDDSLSTKD